MILKVRSNDVLLQAYVWKLFEFWFTTKKLSFLKLISNDLEIEIFKILNSPVHRCFSGLNDTSAFLNAMDVHLMSS